ncbi:Autophagy-related protein 13a [Linum grandiflorum]
MDLHGVAPHSESGKLEQVVSQFLLKTLHIVLDSRIPSLCPRDRTCDSIAQVKKSDKWFNLVLGDRPAALDNLHFWHRNLMDPMIIDIILVQQGSTTSSSVDNLLSASPGSAATETVIERWHVQFESPIVSASRPAEGSASYKKTYKKSIIFLRSLYLQMRLLPAYRIFRQLSSSSQPYNFDIIYKVSSFSEPFSRAEEEMMKEYSFVPIEALPGRLHVSVTYRAQLSEFNLQPLTTMPPKIISDYVGSPAIDPLRYFPSSYKGDSATYFPSKGMHSPTSVPFQRPHSWTSGFYKPPANTGSQPFVGSPPNFRMSPMSYDSPSPPMDRVQNLRRPLHQRAPFQDECQLSPPFSPSVSPSTPTYLRKVDSPRQIHASSETAPVTIPFQMAGRSSRYISPNFSDPSKHSLPPLSPRSTRNDHSSNSNESPSGIRLMKKSEPSKPGDLCYAGHKALKDNRDDSGRFSGLLSSRSSSKLSFQDDIDDCDFSCPFDVDDVDTPDSHISQNNEGKRSLESTSLGRKSQDAAVGVLVHMLRNAPPLRQDSSCYSLRGEVEDGVAATGTASGFFMARRTADALEELRSYREMRDLLLSKSGTRVLPREPP